MPLPQPSASCAALVTGASAGIGLAICHELAARGHNIVLVARRKGRLEEIAAQLQKQHGVRAETLGCDLANAASRSRLPSRVAGLGLDIEVLVNNAGFATNGPFHEADPAREQAQVRVLVEAPVALTLAYLPAMVARGRGAILNVSSTAGMQPLPYSAGYSAAKAYIKTFSEALHEECKRHGVTVTTLCPGPVSTDFWRLSGWLLLGGRSFESAVPKSAWITPEQAAREGVAGLESGARVVVPGVQVRAVTEAAQYLPHWLKLPILERALRSR
jgi:short-subunit dehydrogenase